MQKPSRVALDGLQAALQRDSRWAAAPLEPLADRGLAHLHVRLVGTGGLARIPKQSQLGLAPWENLLHQQACFERAAASGHTPVLRGVLPVREDLPRGALIVEEIVGGAVSLPEDLHFVARALAALHGLPLPPESARPPLATPSDPLEDLVAEILSQASHVPAAGLPADTRTLIHHEMVRLVDLTRGRDRPPRALIAFDAHPGNFVKQADGRAVLVDLEKCRYSCPGLDLAHATLYTSTTWDAAASMALSVSQVADFYASWEQAVPPAMAAASRPWQVPLRRAMWLWSLSWCCKWRALSDRPPRTPQAGEDWSAQNSEPSLVEHVRERVTHYLSAPVIRRVQHELRELERGLA